MKRWRYALLLGLFVCFAVLAVSTEAFAQAGLDRIEQKVQDVQDLVSKVLVVIVVIGAMFVRAEGTCAHHVRPEVRAGESVASGQALERCSRARIEDSGGAPFPLARPVVISTQAHPLG